jgi:hypothetical protein
MSSYRFIKSSHSIEEKTASLSLVKESFGNVDIAHEDYYDWQYLHNPAGKGTVLLAYDGEKAIAQLAAIPCRYEVEGNVTTVTLAINACVSSQYRQQGLLTELIKKMHEVSDPVPFSIAVSNNLSMQAHLKNNYHYNPLRMDFLIRPVQLSNYFQSSLSRAIMSPFNVIWKKQGELMHMHSGDFDRRFDELQKEMHNMHAVRQIRDAAFLNWRYKNNPRRKYVAFTLEGKDGDLDGYLVARISEIFGRRIGLIVDFVAKEQSDSIRNLVRDAIRYFWDNNAALGIAACFPGCIEHQMLRKEGFFACPDRFRPHPLAVGLKNFNKYPDNILLDADRWFFMLGDYETF